MAFRFGLESVLKQRKRVEDIAQRSFMEAQNAVNEILNRLETMYRRLDEVREEILAAQRVGTSEKLEEIRTMDGFLTGHKLRIESVRIEARALLVTAEQKQEELIVSAQERKVLVKLKEKQLAEYKQRLFLLEAKEADDQTMMRQSWRKR